jgi:drug/metabolite transporter (DMT)-like permease
VTTGIAPDRASLRSWLPGFFALAAIWGSSFLFIKVGVAELHPVQLTLYRVAAGALTLLVVLAMLRDRLPREPRVWAHLAVVTPFVAGAPPLPTELSAKVVFSVLALGALGTGLAFVINMRNIRVAGASTASTVTYLIPIFAVLIGAVVLDERLNWHQPVGALIVLLGVAVAQGVFGRRTSRPVVAAGAPAAPAPEPAAPAPEPAAPAPEPVRR